MIVLPPQGGEDGRRRRGGAGRQLQREAPAHRQRVPHQASPRNYQMPRHSQLLKKKSPEHRSFLFFHFHLWERGEGGEKDAFSKKRERKSLEAGGSWLNGRTDSMVGRTFSFPFPCDALNEPLRPRERKTKAEEEEKGNFLIVNLSVRPFSNPINKTILFSLRSHDAKMPYTVEKPSLSVPRRSA